MGLLEQKQEGGPRQQGDPKQQEQYDIFVSNGISIIHSDKTTKALIDQIVKSPDPIEAIADATLGVVKRLQASAASNKIELNDGVVAHGANQLMGEIITIVEAAGMEPLTDEQKQQSFSLAVGKYLEDAVKTGRMTPEQVSRMGQEASQTPEGQKIAAQMESASPKGQGMAQPTQRQGNPGVVR